jgi:hypothetical protein
VYGGWHDAAVDVQPSASVVVLDLTIDFDDAKQFLKANTCRIRRPLGVAHPSLPLLTSREGHSNILRRANHSAVGLATHLVVFGGAGDSVSGDDSLAAFALVQGDVITRIQGITMLVVLAGYLVSSYWLERRDRAAKRHRRARRPRSFR